MTQVTGSTVLSQFNPLIAADQFDLVALGVKAVKTREPAIGRYVAERLANRIFDIHPGFVAEKARLSLWLREEPGWNQTIARFAADPERLGGKVYAALQSLKAFEPGRA